MSGGGKSKSNSSSHTSATYLEGAGGIRSGGNIGSVHLQNVSPQVFKEAVQAINKQTQASNQTSQAAIHGNTSVSKTAIQANTQAETNFAQQLAQISKQAQQGYTQSLQTLVAGKSQAQDQTVSHILYAAVAAVALIMIYGH